ncbi:hypothetical protein [Sphingosinicella sp. CPCC 101087]|nr:hypothetical protein [Sphingosinicella sp. CPCC 101087]
MTTENLAGKRPKLTLPFGRSVSERHMPRSSTLTGSELRRIVTDLIG